MNIIKQDNGQQTRYMGENWRGMQPPVSLKPNDALICCDLRGSKLDGLDLSGVEFFGCRLNGTSFRGAILRRTRFLGCFSSDEASPTDFSNSIREDVFTVDSHINFTDKTLSDPVWGDELVMSHLDPRYPIAKWPPKVAKAATKTLSERNDTRYYGASELGELDNPIVTPLLGCLLADPEWEVRSIGLEVLAKLRHQQFPEGDRWLLEWMFLRLGDEHSMVRQIALDLVETISPPDDVLLAAIDKMMAGSSEQQRLGLRTAIDLCEIDEEYLNLIARRDNVLLSAIQKMMAGSPEEQLAGIYAAIDLCELDDKYLQLVSPKPIQLLVKSENAKVREQASELYELLDDVESIPNLLPSN